MASGGAPLESSRCPAARLPPGLQPVGALHPCLQEHSASVCWLAGEKLHLSTGQEPARVLVVQGLPLRQR